MAYSINGFGTTYYGQRAFERDGSYITTKWAIAGTLPLVPLGSIRVKQGRDGLYVVDEEGMDWLQVLLIYLYVYLLVPYSIYLIANQQRSFIDDYRVPFAVVILIKTLPFLFVLALPHLLRWWSRHEAKKAPVRKR